MNEANYIGEQIVILRDNAQCADVRKDQIFTIVAQLDDLIGIRDGEKTWEFSFDECGYSWDFYRPKPIAEPRDLLGTKDITTVNQIEILLEAENLSRLAQMLRLAYTAPMYWRPTDKDLQDITQSVEKLKTIIYSIRLENCNKCRQNTPTENGDCWKCRLSKPTGQLQFRTQLTEEENSLAEQIIKEESENYDDVILPKSREDIEGK